MSGKFKGAIDIRKTSFINKLNDFIENDIIMKYELKYRKYGIRTPKDLNTVSRLNQARKFYNSLDNYIKKYYVSKDLIEAIAEYIDYMIPEIYIKLKYKKRRDPEELGFIYKYISI